MRKQSTRQTTRQHVLGVRVSSELKAEIEAAAAQRQWSISQWLALAARAVLDKEGKN